MNKNQYLIQLSESDRTDFGRIDFDQKNEAQKVFSAIWALESQVNNGGFLQDFESGDGDTASFAPTALTRIGATACARIVQSALDLVGSPLPADRDTRLALVQDLPETTRAGCDPRRSIL